MKNRPNNKGYTLLFAVLVSALVIAVGVSILSISRKELILTAGARNSEYAFYAADSGYECALYNDYNGPGGSTLFSTSTPPTSVTCGTMANGSQYNSHVTASTTVGSPTVYDFTFYMPIAASATSTACAYVDVNKIYNSSGVSTTTVSSTGYNIGWETSPTTDCGGSNNDSEKVNREVVTTYEGS